MDLPVSLIENYIKRGSILLSDIFEIDHPKFFVVLAVTEESVIGFFYINSKINSNIIRKDEQYKLQYLLSPIDYTFLNHDSYIDATKISEIQKQVISRSIMDGNTSLKGELKDNHLQELLTLLRESKLFTPIQKRMYFY